MNEAGLFPSSSFRSRSLSRFVIIPALFLFFSCAFVHAVEIAGELKQWHKVIVLLDGPDVKEEPTTFRDYRLNVTFTKGAQTFVIPGHYAADGNAGHTGANSGNKWRAFFNPNETGEWTYIISFRQGTLVAVSLDPEAGSPLAPYDGQTGTFQVGPSDKLCPDFRARGMLQYVGEHFQQFSGDKTYWIDVGPGSPENLFGGSEFDATRGPKYEKRQWYSDHQESWREGDPTWGSDNRGKGVIGALNYIIELGQTSIFVGMMNLGCDSKDTWPWAEEGPFVDEDVNILKEPTVDIMSTFDVSKLDQWEMTVAHGQKHGVLFHAYFSEEEDESIYEWVEGLQMGGNNSFADVRKLYFRELISRLGHFNAIDWSMGEEWGGLHNKTKDQVHGHPVISDGQKVLFADYVNALDPYGHSNGYEGDRNRYERDYGPWFNRTQFNRASLMGWTPQANFYSTELRRLTKESGRPWVIKFSEHHGPAAVPDMNAALLSEFRGSAWGSFLGGGASVEWWLSEDDYYLRSYKPYRTLMEEAAHVRDFMLNHLPFWQMEPANGLLQADAGYCYALEGQIYGIYLHDARNAELDLSGMTGEFDVYWYDPLNGGDLKSGTVDKVTGGSKRSLGLPPARTDEDWAVLVRNRSKRAMPGKTLK
ncbi:DUF5060 domain-containing protein [Planctomycetota bacterium]